MLLGNVIYTEQFLVLRASCECSIMENTADYYSLTGILYSITPALQSRHLNQLLK